MTKVQKNAASASVSSYEYVKIFPVQKKYGTDCLDFSLTRSHAFVKI